MRHTGLLAVSVNMYSTSRRLWKALISASTFLFTIVGGELHNNFTAPGPALSRSGSAEPWKEPAGLGGTRDSSVQFGWKQDGRSAETDEDNDEDQGCKQQQKLDLIDTGMSQKPSVQEEK